MFTLLITLLLGIIIGLLLVFLMVRTIKIKCPSCKQFRPLKEIAVFHWKPNTITGQACAKCQRPKPQIEIML